jgi:transcription-repair coupling factor (superfamily II helicase)
VQDGAVIDEREAESRDGDQGEADGPKRPRGALALDIVARWREAGSGGLLFLSAGEQQAEYLGANINSLFPDCPVLVFPRWDSLPYDPAGPSREVSGRRASVLRRLAGGLDKPLLIATPEAILQRVPPREIWKDAALRVALGTAVAEIEAFLRQSGYGLDMLVDEPGEAAVHGQVVDVFPAGALGPVRIEHEDGRVTRIDSYDPTTQRTVDELPEIVLDAASEFGLPEAPGEAADDPGETPSAPFLSAHYPKLDTLFDYLPGTTVLIEDHSVETRGALWFEQIREAYESVRLLAGAAEIGGAAPVPEHLFLSPAEWDAVRCRAEPVAAPRAEERVPLFATARNPASAYRAFIAEQRAAGRRIVLAASDERDLKVLARRAAPERPRPVSGWDQLLDAPDGELLLLRADFEAGFLHPADNAAVIAAADLLGSRAGHSQPMELAHGALGAVSETALRIGDAVIHIEHGIGKLRGIETVTASGIAEQEALRIEYARGAMLMVPVGEIEQVWRYGAGSEAVPLDRLDGEAWKKRREQVERDIAETARGLRRLTREREAKEAPKLDPPARRYERFVAGFPFVPTVDQARAVEDILADLKSGHPMDRLVCGDVGFGKTEVALRAAAAAVFGGYQVALVAPTTVLVRQHLNIFRRRFAPFGTRIAGLSRLVTPAEARAVKHGLRDGSVDIVIGTHAVAGKGVGFDRLGLLVIDEEQRFGTRIKDKLRGFADGVHVLTLSATPIPRTLQGAILGLYALSALETPPARRLPVQTVLTPFDPGLVRQALAAEKRRQGQSFVVVPRIEDIEPIADRLRALVPELDLKVVHGKMPAAEIDEVMVAFADGAGDVLLATDIIESGLDLPRANTILIWRPDRFGVAQLHQLRGRVGRGRRRGLAFLLTDPEETFAPATEKRLRLLTEHNRLGAGFAISRRDMDMRGAGELLGEKQAGHVRLIGIELYRHLLDRALDAARGETLPSDRPIEVNLGGAAAGAGSIPADYVSDPEIRLNLYARLARLRDPGRIDDFVEELADRFGPPPQVVRDLLDAARVREMARRAGAVRVDAGPRGIAVAFDPAGPVKQPRSNGGIAGFHWKNGRLVAAQPGTENSVIDALTELFDRLDCL